MGESTTAFRTAFAGLALATVVGTACARSSPAAPTAGPPPALPAPLTTMLSFTSDPASRVGQGLSRTYTLANARFFTTAPIGRVTVLVEATEERATWGLVMDAPRGQPLVPGRYSVARPGQTDGHAFDLAGGPAGTACFTGSGTMTIDEFDQTGGALARLRASFEFSCDGAPPIRGNVAVHWVSGQGFK
jgi:hypothetical protein